MLKKSYYNLERLVIDLVLGLKNTSYQLCDFRQLGLKYLIHILLKINTTLPVNL
jgi:hypothetical protein